MGLNLYHFKEIQCTHIYEMSVHKMNNMSTIHNEIGHEGQRRSD